jgi:hypothetical protein
MPIVKIRIDAKGRIFKEFLGFKGLECNKADKLIDGKVPNLKLKVKAEKIKKDVQYETEKQYA